MGKENNSKQEKEEEEIYDVNEIYRTMRREKVDGQEEEELVKNETVEEKDGEEA